MFRVDDATVAIVEDDRGVREALEMLMASCRYHCRSYHSAEAFLHQPLPPSPCCLLTDLNLPGMDGLALQAALADLGQHIPILFLSGHADAAQADSAMQAGALTFLYKPPDPQQLLTYTQRGLEISLQ